MPSALADEWTAQDTQRETGFLILQAIDFAQTRNMTHLCTIPGATWQEQNAALGRCPSLSKVNSYFFLTTATHIAIADYLPHQLRRDFQNVTIGIELEAVTYNFSLGISASF